MLKKAAFAYTFVLIAGLGLWLFSTLHISKADRIRFKELQQKGKAVLQASHPRSSQQSRAGVQKDLWITGADGRRLHDRIESLSSVLTLTPIDDHLDIIEHLSQIHCSMQDRITEQEGQPVQQVRYFEAASGIYQYSTNRFTAQSVSLALFRLPGTDLPLSFSQKSPFLKGIAQDVSFAVAGKSSQFQAKYFKATFEGEKP